MPLLPSQSTDRGRSPALRPLRFSGYAIIALLLIWLAFTLFRPSSPARTVPYSELVAHVRADRVKEVHVRPNRLGVVLKPAPGAESEKPAALLVKRLPRHDESALLREMVDRGVVLTGEGEEGAGSWQLLLVTVGPLALLVLLFALGRRSLRAGAGSALSFGKSRAKVYDRSQEERVTFADVAGVDEAQAELAEVVDFLQHPEKYLQLGARIPRGVLLVGAPGTGKTLLARAVAGEANVPFFSLSGSEFVEMFVGVGAARMRDLFEQAKQRAPCIVFIDELDAIGKSRGGLGALATHDEREQTLNQLLVEMDGFDTSKGVVIMSATNRPEVLDPALLRAGRFDRQVIVDRPDLQGRLEILRVHARKVQLAPGVDLKVIAQRTPGMVGADLANVVNEAALAAARGGSSSVSGPDFEEAIDRIQLGLKKRGRAMNEEEKRRVAYHEAGHALVALSVEHADPVHRVTIIPRSVGALGATLQLPTEDRYLMTRAELTDRLAVMLGGRSAEEIACGDISTGAQNDLERATETARQMVCRFGMSERLGPLTFGRPLGARFLETAVSFGEERNFSEETARAIDAEVRGLVERAHERARRVLEERRLVLENIARRLLAVETLDRAELMRLTGAGSDQRSAASRVGSGPPS